MESHSFRGVIYQHKRGLIDSNPPAEFWDLVPLTRMIVLAARTGTP